MSSIRYLTTLPDIDWDAPCVSVRMSVELPFYLLVADNVRQIPLENIIVRARISNTECVCIEGRSDRDVLSLLSRDDPDFASICDKENVGIQLLRTVISFDAYANEDAINVLFYNDMSCSPKMQEEIKHHNMSEKLFTTRRTNVSIRYMKTLGLAHVYLVNKIIEAYRSIVFDPLVYNVSERDISCWFVEYKDELKVVYVAQSNDGYPHIPEWDFEGDVPVVTEEKRVYLLTDSSLLDQYISKPALPEVQELLDAWSLYFRSNYGGAIRSAVTAVEVALDRSIRESKKVQGESGESIERYFRCRENTFLKRLDDYEKTRKSFIPIVIPIFECFSLRTIIQEMRELRHAIAHRGLRLTHINKRKTLFYLELVTQLFLWIYNKNDFPDYSQLLFLKTHAGDTDDYLGFKCNNGRIEVYNYPVRSPDETNFEKATFTYQINRLLEEYAYGSEANLDFFALASMYCVLHLHSNEDIQRSLADDRIDERFLFSVLHEVDSRLTLAFAAFTLAVCPDKICDALLKVVNRLTDHARLYPTDSQPHPVCFVSYNLTRSAFYNAKNYHVVDNKTEVFARENNITIVSMQAILMLCHGVLYGFWSRDDAISILHVPGEMSAPPGHIKVGAVCHVYPKANVLSIILEQDLSLNDNCILWNMGKLASIQFESMQINRVDVVSGKSGAVMGLKLSVPVVHISKDALIFRKL